MEKSKTENKRLPRKSRAKKPPVMQLTTRDVEIVKAVLEYRFLSIEQCTWFFPKDSSRGIINRLRLLYHNRYLERVSLPVNKSANFMVYSLTEKGAQLIAEADNLMREEVLWSRHLNKVTTGHINHLLEINNVIISAKIALETAQNQGQVKDYKLIRTEPKKNKISVLMRDADGHRFEASVIPDIILGILFQTGYTLFFVEIDRSTMTTSRWQEKISVYREYTRAPELLERFKNNSFNVLTVTTSSKRIESLASKTVEIGGKRCFWFTEISNIKPDNIFDKIWVKASDLFDLKQEKAVTIGAIASARRYALIDAMEREHYDYRTSY